MNNPETTRCFFDRIDIIEIRKISMLPFAYTITSDLRENLRQIDLLRIPILTLPLSTAVEHMIRWQARINRIGGSLALAGIKVTKNEIEQTLADGHKHGAPIVTGYNNAMTYIEDTWIANPKSVTADTLAELRDLVYIGPFASYKRAFASDQRSMKQLFQYLENQEHAVVRAGIASGILTASILGQRHAEPLAHLMATLYLSNEGYLLRGLAAPEYQWSLEPGVYRTALESISREGNLNIWLLYFAQSLCTHYEKLAAQMAQPSKLTPSKIALLNDRQRAIIHLLDNPQASLTNKTIQKRFRISQITASRDLAKLTALGIFVPHGKGRAVSYTRI